MVDCQKGAVEILIVWENMKHVCVELENPEKGEEVIKILSKAQMVDMSNFVDKDSGVALETREQKIFVQ